MEDEEKLRKTREKTRVLRDKPLKSAKLASFFKLKRKLLRKTLIN